MRLREFIHALIENSFPLDGVDYLFEPSLGQIQALLARSQRKLVRGLVDAQGQFIVWDAYLRTHEDAEIALGEAGLIQGPTYAVVISRNVLVTYQNTVSCDPHELRSEAFQQFLGRVIKSGYQTPGAGHDPTRMNESLTRNPILRNPTTNALRNLVDQSPNRIVKGLYDPRTGDIWAAPGWNYAHYMIANDANLNDSYLFSFVIAASKEPGRYGVILIGDGGHSTDTSEHEELKQHPFFRLPQIARLNWADLGDRSWREAWR